MSTEESGKLFRVINAGCGLFILVVSWQLFKLVSLSGGDRPPRPNEGPLSGLLLAITSPYVVAAVGVILIAVNLYGFIQNRPANRA